MGKYCCSSQIIIKTFPRLTYGIISCKIHKAKTCHLKSELSVLFEDDMACFCKNKREWYVGKISSFNSLPKVSGMPTFGATVVNHRSNYLSQSQIGQSHESQCNSYNIDTMEHIIGANWHSVCRFGTGSGQNGPIPYFFSISKEYNYIL